MSGSGKGLLGLWLYRNGSDWQVKKEASQSKVDQINQLQQVYHGGEKISVIFTVKNQVGGLVRVLSVFQDLGINVLHIESRKSLTKVSASDILVDVQCDPRRMEQLKRMLKREISDFEVVQTESGGDFAPPTPLSAAASFDFGEMPWFPRNISDLDRAQNVLMYGSELDADHPGFKDPVYRKRREQFAAIANNYKYGQPIPKVQYTETEIKTWGIVFRELHKLYQKFACEEYLENWPQLVKYCGYREDNLPQLEDVSVFLKRKTGFQLRPVAGYLSPRDFLSGLAFRVFHCTQYIRHSSDPFYTPEPDCCHELLGHMPLLANPSFAQFSQEIGLASLGASDEDINKLATFCHPTYVDSPFYIQSTPTPYWSNEPRYLKSEQTGMIYLFVLGRHQNKTKVPVPEGPLIDLNKLYFFTVEFGLCRQSDGTFRVYGAGLLSSVAELQHALATPGKIKHFDPDVTVNEECIITSYQNAYYYTDSFEEAKEKMRSFAESIQRPFGVRYNPYTQSVEVLSNAQKITALVQELRGDICIVSSAIKKISAQDSTLDVETIANMLHTGLQVSDRSPQSTSGGSSPNSERELSPKPEPSQ